MPLIPAVETLARHTPPKAPPPFPDGAHWLRSLPKGEVTAVFGYSHEVAWALEPGQNVLFIEEDLAVIADALDTHVELHHLDPHLFVHLAKKYPLKRLTCACLPRCEHLQDQARELEQTFAMYRHHHEELEGGAEAFVTNFFANLKHLPGACRASSLHGQFKGVPAIICGAGPSLEKHDLGPLRDRALILAGGSAIRKVGHLAHLGGAVDPNYTEFQQLMGSRAFELPLLYRSRLYPEVLERWQGPHLYVGGAGGYPMADYFDEAMGVSQPPICEGYNVICFLTSLAQKFGCDPILYVGMDLSENGKTCSKWISEGRWISSFPTEATLLNCTEGGMGIGELPNVPLLEALAQKSRPIEVLPLLRPLNPSPPPIGQWRESLLRCLDLLEQPTSPLIEVELDTEIAYRYHLKLFHHKMRAAHVCLKSMP